MSISDLQVPAVASTVSRYGVAARTLRNWIEAQSCAGYEPYDLLNSPYLQHSWTRSRFLAPVLIQAGRRLGGGRLRRWLSVPPSVNPKALALCLMAYCELQQTAENCIARAEWARNELARLKSPNELFYCWGYDWDFISIRGAVLKKFYPNCIATVFAGNALLEAAEVFGDTQAADMAESAGEFLTQRLNRSIDTAEHLCLSYTPDDRTRIFNSSVLAGAFLCRLWKRSGHSKYLQFAQRIMKWLADAQAPDGSWCYGMSAAQHWIDSFHTGYNLCGLLDYRRITGDTSFHDALDLGYEYFNRCFFTSDGRPKYFHNRLYPIDIHCCSQAILTFCAFRERDSSAMGRAQALADWTLNNMRSEDGTFFYQRHKYWINKTAYMRWGQAWMLYALAMLDRCLRENPVQDKA